MDMVKAVIASVIFFSGMLWGTSSFAITSAYYDSAHNGLDLKPDYHQSLLYELTHNQKKWYAKRPYTYQYVLKRECECGDDYKDPVYIKVRHGSVSQAYTESDRDVMKRAKSIDQLFDVIRDEINVKAAKINVKYHPRLGYPTSIYIDFSLRIDDEEMLIKIADLEPITR